MKKILKFGCVRITLLIFKQNILIKKEWKVMKVVKMSGRERNMRNHSPVNKIDSRRAME